MKPRLKEFLKARADVIRHASTLVALWDAQKISGATRAERNAAIDDVRNKLSNAVHAMERAELLPE